uniref:Uncharacterized protein n=1 Tax=Cacopsylla melanoneura TaxID=428564 RepID=A0A8D8T5F3_9HEMI
MKLFVFAFDVTHTAIWANFFPLSGYSYRLESGSGGNLGTEWDNKNPPVELYAKIPFEWPNDAESSVCTSPALVTFGLQTDPLELYGVSSFHTMYVTGLTCSYTGNNV